MKCQTAKRLAIRAADPERDREACRRWVKRHPDRAAASARRVYERNREKRIAQATAWNKRNPAKRSKIMVFQNAKRRSRIEGNGGRGFTKRQWLDVVARFDGLCAYCRTAPADSIDHFVPLSRGGPHDITNILPACRHCNCLKRDADPIEWVSKACSPETLRVLTLALAAA